MINPEGMLRRIILGVGANAFSQIVSIGIQLASLPLFLMFWDAQTYGEWLLLSALPAYLSMSDFGVIGAAGNKMTMAIGRSDAARANVIYQSAQLFMTIVCGAIALVGTPALLLAPMPAYMTTDMRIALTALCLGVLIGLHGGLADAVFKATGRYAAGTMLGQCVRVAEWLGWIFGLIVFRNFTGVAVTGLVANALGNALRLYVAQKGEHGLRLGFRDWDRREFVDTIKPALSFTIYTLANALNFQGMTLLVGAVAGPASVVMFNSYRTIARVSVQASAMFSHALWPEFARLYGEGGMSGVRALFMRSAIASGLQAAALNVAIYFLSPWLLRVWTHGRIDFEPGLMALLLSYATVCGLWHVPRILLMATNQHAGISYWALITAAFAIALGWALSFIWPNEAAGAAMLASESLMAAICVVFVRDAFGGRRVSDAPKTASDLA